MALIQSIQAQVVTGNQGIVISGNVQDFEGGSKL